MNILIYKWKVFNQADVKSAFEYFGHSVDMYEEKPLSSDSITGRKEHDYVMLADVFREYDVIFSLNYFPHVSDICEQTGRKYVAWTVDSPLISLYHQSVFNSCNNIFIFDKFFYYELKQLGVKNIYYLPLAVNTDRLNSQLNSQTREEKDRFSADISFVGSMYHKNSYDDIKDKLPPYLRGYFDAAMLAQLNIYGDNIIDELLTVDILKQLSEFVDFRQDKRAFSDIRLVFESTFLGFKLANIERVRTLNLLAKKNKVALYTDEQDTSLINVDFKGTVDYMNDMPKVFNNSSINLNMTIRNIRTGIPLRVWDILGAGGFLLTNYQIELTDYFKNEESIVYYEDMYDCCKKAEYYLLHEDKRRQIAAKGHELVSKKHSYINRVKYILDVIGKMS